MTLKRVAFYSSKNRSMQYVTIAMNDIQTTSDYNSQSVITLKRAKRHLKGLRDTYDDATKKLDLQEQLLPDLNYLNGIFDEPYFRFRYDETKRDRQDPELDKNYRDLIKFSRRKSSFLFPEEETFSVHRIPEHDENIVCDMIISPDLDGDCVLFISIICEKRDLTLSLVNILCSPRYLQVTNKLFQNALHLATIIGDHVTVRRLLVGGIEVERKDRHGNTALHIACHKGDIKIAKAILTPIRYQETTVNRYKAPFRRIPQNMEIRNNEGLTCLHVAAKQKDLSMIELLLSKDADVNARQMKDGRTILHHFCEIGELKCVEFLLKRNDLNINARSYCGTTATEIAKNRGHSMIESLLIYAGAYLFTYCMESGDEVSESDSD